MTQSARRRDERRAAHAARKVIQMVQPLHTLPVYNLVNEERVQIIHDKSMQILEEAPPLDDGIDEQLRDFMARRKREIR